MFPIPAVFWKIGGALFIALALLVGGYTYGHHIEALVFDKYKADVQAASYKAQADAEHHAMRVQEVASQEQAAAVATYEEKIGELDKDKAALIYALSSGDVRVRVPVTNCRPGSVSASTGTPGVGNGGATAELQSKTAIDLINIAADADRLAAQLAAAQQVIRSDRDAINGK